MAVVGEVLFRWKNDAGEGAGDRASEVCLGGRRMSLANERGPQILRIAFAVED